MILKTENEKLGHIKKKLCPKLLVFCCFDVNSLKSRFWSNLCHGALRGSRQGQKLKIKKNAKKSLEKTKKNTQKPQQQKNKKKIKKRSKKSKISNNLDKITFSLHKCKIFKKKFFKVIFLSFFLNIRNTQFNQSSPVHPNP